MSKVWRYGDHVDTDVIIPARYLNIADFDELAEHAMEDIDTTFAPNVQPGDYVVAGKNFGCGSSREHAPVVIKVKGVKCIIADSFARIFYRNAINIGLPVLEIGKEVEKILMRNDPEDGVQGGATLWKLTQAITAHARELSPERSRELHELSGQLLNRVKVTA